MRHNIIGPTRTLIRLIVCLAMIASAAAPTAAAQNPYPDISNYQGTGALGKYRALDKDGVWFTTPVGMRCGIADDGSYGCSGSGQIPGAQHGENEIAWFPGDSFPRLYHTDQPRFDSGKTQTVIPAYHFLSYHGSKCAVTVEGRAYCINGENIDSQIMVGGNMAWRGGQAQTIS